MVKSDTSKRETPTEAAAAAPQTKTSGRIRRGVFLVHLWLGLTLGLWFSAIGLSGSVLAWLPDLLPREIMARFPYDRPGAAIIPPSAAVAAMRTAHPEAAPPVTASLSLPGREIPYYLFALPNAKDPFAPNLVLVDPTSGRARPPLAITSLTLGWIASVHTNLTKGIVGMIVNGALSLLALPLLLSGLWLWWPPSLKHLRQRLTVKRGVSLQRRLYDWHNVLGIYPLAILCLNTFTATLMVADFVTKQGVTHTLNRAAGQRQERPVTVKAQGVILPLDTLAARAQAAMPGAELERLTQAAPGQPFRASYETGTELLRGGEIDLDPYSGAVLRVSPDAAGPAGDRALHLAGVLHYGSYGGVWTQVLYSLAGLTPLGLFVTGVWKWAKRRWRR